MLEITYRYRLIGLDFPHFHSKTNIAERGPILVMLFYEWTASLKAYVVLIPTFICGGNIIGDKWVIKSEIGHNRPLVKSI